MYGDLVRLTLFPAARSPNPNWVPFIFTSYFCPKVEINKYLPPSHFAFLWCVFLVLVTPVVCCYKAYVCSVPT